MAFRLGEMELVCKANQGARASRHRVESRWRDALAPWLRGLALLVVSSHAHAADIERIWLTYRTPDDTKLTINWETKEPTNTGVEYWTDDSANIVVSREILQSNPTTLHHWEIPVTKPDTVYHYRALSGNLTSDVHSFRSLPNDELRVAVIADSGYAVRPWAAAVLAQKPHLLLSAGDHIPALHKGQPVPPDTTTAFSALIDTAPELFRSTPWIPVLGNHDREMRPRGATPPAEPVYDVDATAFRKFFGLPADGWHSQFDIPRFGVRFVGGDLSHLSDQGTTWQTCHPFTRGSEQFTWFQHMMKESPQPFLIPIYNEKNSAVRGLMKGSWGRLIARGSLAISGFGYFAERAEVDGFPYFNTAVKGDGAKYADPGSAAFFSEDNFLLLAFQREPRKLRVEMRNLEGKVLDTREVAPRPTAP